MSRMILLKWTAQAKYAERGLRCGQFSNQSANENKMKTINTLWHWEHYTWGYIT